MKNLPALLLALCLSSCASTNTRWGWLVPETSAVFKKHTPEGIIVYDPSTYHQPGARMKWHGMTNAASEAQGLGVLTLISEDGTHVTDSELGEMKDGRLQGIVYGNHKTGGRAIWRYESGRKMELVIAWDNRHYQRPTTPGWEERFPPIGSPGQDWRGFAQAEQRRRDEEAAKARALAAKRRTTGGLSFEERFFLNVAGAFLGAFTNPQGGSSVSSEPSDDRGAIEYVDMTVTYDQHAGSSATSGTNTIQARSSRYEYSFTYDFGGGAYLIPVGGDLSGRTVNVKFVGDEPVSIKSSHGRVDVGRWNRR